MIPCYLSEYQPTELPNYYLQQELDKIAERLVHPANLNDVQRGVTQIAKKYPNSHSKNLF
jgi:hypothetical protein